MPNIQTFGPLSNAPQYIRPYLDCVDGAQQVALWVSDSGVPMFGVWELYRDGEAVGLVTVEIP